MPREMRTISVVILAVCILAGCAQPNTRPAPSPPAQSDRPELSFEAQMDVFYIDRMGRVPDRYDYLLHACKAAVFAEVQTDPELKKFAEAKLEEYLRGWRTASRHYPQAYLEKRFEGAQSLSQQLRNLLSNAASYSHKKEIDMAVQELETEIEKGITKPSTATE